MFLFQDNVPDNASNCPPSGRLHKHSACMSIWQPAAACPTSIWMEAVDAAAAASSSSIFLGWRLQTQMTTKVETDGLYGAARRWRWQAHSAVALALEPGWRRAFTGKVSRLLVRHISTQQTVLNQITRTVIISNLFYITALNHQDGASN